MSLPYIMVAPNGARRTKADHRALPISIPEVVETARQCFAVGANGIHAHVRGSQDEHVLDAGLYRELISELALVVPKMDVQITTEAVGIYSPQEQMQVVQDVYPKMVSIALAELSKHPDRAELSQFYHSLADDSIDVQHILYDPAEVQQFEQFVDQGVIPNGAPSFLFVLGRYTAGQQSNPLHFDPFHSAMQASPFSSEAKVMTCAFGGRETACLVHAASFGSDCRVGFENNLYMADQINAPDNGARVGELISKLKDAATNSSS
ncbi:3-keto-5-aminohexanoate cleavage protein [Maritalea sp.]|uniref:3-keto-5-aminohexanoate cleavage protein n=1 Tax=Maritalea sp. TaxID=2003361 RepID=UPI003EF4EA50